MSFKMSYNCLKTTIKHAYNQIKILILSFNIYLYFLSINNQPPFKEFYIN